MATMKPSGIPYLTMAALAALTVTACTSPSSRIHDDPAEFAQLKPEQQALVLAGQPGLGFNPAQVKLSLGEPDRVTTIQTKDGTDIVWHYTTYESGGRFLFTGSYFAGRRGLGGAYDSYYLDFPDRRVRDRFRLVFHEGLLTTIVRGSEN